MKSDQTILLLIDILKELKVIKFDTEFCREIGLLKQNLVNIRKGKNHFTPDHIEQIVKKYDVNANWIFGASGKVFNKEIDGLKMKKEHTNSHTKTGNIA